MLHCSITFLYWSASLGSLGYVWKGWISILPAYKHTISIPVNEKNQISLQQKTYLFDEKEKSWKCKLYKFSIEFSNDNNLPWFTMA